MINQLICIFLPSVVAMKMENKIKNKEMKIINKIEDYLLYVMCTNIILYFIVNYILGYMDIAFTSRFTIKYIASAVIIAVSLPLIKEIISSNINIKIKVKKNEEKD